MGLSIYYKGKFRSNASLSKMIDEVKDTAEIHKWKYHIFKRTFPVKCFGKKSFNEDIYGCLFSPPQSEPVMLCFLSNGIMANPFMLEYYLKTGNEKDKELIYSIFTKTQYAGVDVHKTIINFLRHVSKKYLQDFSLTDEGHYWETGDEKLLEKTFAEYKGLLDSFSGALENNKIQAGETIENFIVRIAEQIKKKKVS
ncbi:MAG: hypothetical protein FVQ77_00250 [Cytophagales bacterium]|nr:hypothetical protein [Cytophagales bacterium]